MRNNGLHLCSGWIIWHIIFKVMIRNFRISSAPCVIRCIWEKIVMRMLYGQHSRNFGF